MEERDWSQLPEDMLIQISNHFQTYRFESIRFRSVCQSWRKSSPPLPPALSLNPIILPMKKIYDDFGKLVETTVYLIRRPNKKKDFQSESEFESDRAWLIKVEEDKTPNVIHPLDVITRELIIPSPKTVPTGLSLLDFVVTGVCKEYLLVPKQKAKYMSKLRNDFLYLITSFNPVQKIVVSSSTCTANNKEDCVIMVLRSSESLCCFRYGADKWSDIAIDQDSSKSYFSDIIYYQRQFYFVENTGRTCVIDPYTLSTTLVANPIIHGYLEKKRLLESNGELFLVDIFVNEDGPTVRHQQDSFFQSFPIDCKVFRLDKQRKLWIEVQSLDDRVFFVSNNCSFSIPAMDFSGCKGNCILLLNYFFLSVADIFDHDIGIFDLDGHTFSKLLSPHSSYLQLFWPPPRWISAPAP
ncbi:hypothetical protein AQUCO_04100017v1 [Aquilegia coerulea]|uniref:KIB1-4 beta-propeller domain-containing protein n=1 Tax=Aquilegia coerulea TaxID=218851 RepID=A0A2G5CPT2_AQUCA|nr:hypothetical protein AQUCO_04100017v1 [Aquilegia coerulea]